MVLSGTENIMLMKGKKKIKFDVVNSDTLCCDLYMLFSAGTWIRGHCNRKLQRWIFSICTNFFGKEMKRVQIKNYKAPWLGSSTVQWSPVKALQMQNLSRRMYLNQVEVKKTRAKCRWIYSDIFTIKPKDEEGIIPTNK